MNRRRLLFAWQPVLTDHQAFTFEALAKQAAVPMKAYVMRMEDETRRAQGWSDTQVASIERCLIPAHGSLLYCYQQLLMHRNELHFFSGAFESPLIMLCMLIASWLHIEFYLISEPYSPKSFSYFGSQHKLKESIKTNLRPLMYWLYARVFLRKVAGVFAISQLALKQYRLAGIPSAKLFPFGYFVPQVKLPPFQQSSDALRVVFVGALIERKGLNILIDAVKQLRQSGINITLDIFGSGDISSYEIETQSINYVGLIPFGHAQTRIAGYDLLVLPSQYDGWGVVVNEALCAGVPVVCSDLVGAGVLVSRYGVGMTFKSGESKALAQVLAEIYDSKKVLQKMRQGTIIAGAAIQPKVAADYMFKVIEASPRDKVSVPSPWYTST